MKLAVETELVTRKIGCIMVLEEEATPNSAMASGKNLFDQAITYGSSALLRPLSQISILKTLRGPKAQQLLAQRRTSNQRRLVFYPVGP